MKHNYRAKRRFPTPKNQGAKMIPVQSNLFPRVSPRAQQIFWYFGRRLFQQPCTARRTKQVSWTSSPCWCHHVNMSSVEILGILNDILLWAEYKLYRFYYRKLKPLRYSASPSYTNNAHISRTTTLTPKISHRHPPLVHAAIYVDIFSFDIFNVFRFELPEGGILCIFSWNQLVVGLIVVSQRCRLSDVMGFHTINSIEDCWTRGTLLFRSWAPPPRPGQICLASLAWLKSASRLAISWLRYIADLQTCRLKSVSWLVGYRHLPISYN